MIQIQIATSLTEDGVGDIRWVLLDPSEAAPMAVPPAVRDAAPARAALAPPAADPASDPAFEATLPAGDELPAAPTAGRADDPAPGSSERGAGARWLRGLAVVAVLAIAGWYAWNAWQPTGAAKPAATRAVR